MALSARQCGRRLPDVGSNEPSKRSAALRQAVNAAVQATAADINKLALVRLHNALEPYCRLLLTFHDSVWLEVPQANAEGVARQVQGLMAEPPPEFAVPLGVEIRLGRSWGECKRSPLFHG